MMHIEFLCLALYFIARERTARRPNTDGSYLHTLRVWTAEQSALSVVFLVLMYLMPTGFLVPFGALYLVSLGIVLGVTIRTRATIEAPSGMQPA